MLINVKCDTNQSRLFVDQVAIVSGSSEMDETTFDNIIYDPVNSLLMLKPYRFDEDWFSNASGNYARLGLSDFAATGVWQEQLIPAVSAGTWIGLAATFVGIGSNLNANGGKLVTNSSYSKNRGFTISYYNYGGSESISKTPVLNVGWGTTVATATYFALYGDGNVDFYKDGVFRSRNSMSGTPSNQTPLQTKRQQSKNTYSFVDFTAIPYNHNQILAWSLNGGSFVLDFDEIEPEDTNPTIAPAGKFFIDIPPNRAIKMQFAPILFHSSGSGISLQSNFVEPPFSGANKIIFDNAWGGSQQYRTYGFPAYVGIQTGSITLKQWDGTTNFVPNDTSTEAKLKFDLSTNNNGYTPTVFGGQIAYEALNSSTNGEYEDDIGCWVQSLTLNHGDDNAACTVSMKLVDYDDISFPAINTQLYRPFKIVTQLESYTIVIFDGIVTDLQENFDNGYKTLDMTLTDQTWFLDNYIFADRQPLVGEQLNACISFLAQKSGNIAIDVYNPNIRLPMIADQNVDNWGEIIHVGDTAGDKLANIIDAYMPGNIYGFFPKNGEATFRCRPRDQYTETYDGLAISRSITAVNGLGTDDVFYNLQTTVIPPEANSIRVTGQNPKTKELFQVYKEDANSIEPYVAPFDRPENWIGTRKKYGIMDSQYTSVGIASYACDLMYERLTKVRKIYEFDSNVLSIGTSLIWKGDFVKLYGVGATSNVITTQIQAVQLNFIKDDYVRATYTVEQVD